MLTAFVSGPAPWKFPPISAVPPPTSPDTSTLAPSIRPTVCPSILTVPPVCPMPLPEASSVPLASTVPGPSADSTITPFWMPTLFASITPLVLITFSTTCEAEAALTRTVPPSAKIWPVFDTWAIPCVPTLLPTSKLMRLSPYRSSVNVLPDARATVAMRALMVPSFATCGPTSAAKPWLATVIVPWLTTEAPATLDGWEKL